MTLLASLIITTHFLVRHHGTWLPRSATHFECKELHCLQYYNTGNVNGLQYTTSNANGLQYEERKWITIIQYEKLQWFTQSTRDNTGRVVTSMKQGPAAPQLECRIGRPLLENRHFVRYSDPEYCLVRRRKSSPNEPTINWALCMSGSSLAKRTQFPRRRVREALSTTHGKQSI